MMAPNQKGGKPHSKQMVRIDSLEGGVAIN
jgi:hypothetical protein